MMKKFVGDVLIVLGLLMLYLGYQMQGLAPAVTGAGFLAVAVVFLVEEKS